MRRIFSPFLIAVLLVKLVGVALWFWSDWGWPGLLLCFFGADLWVIFEVFVPTRGLMCPVVRRFETDLPEVWLTIDDGPDPNVTPKLLALLDQHGAKATFFMIGERAARHPELVEEVARRGHSLGCHTHTHPVASFWAAGWGRCGAEIDLAMAALRGGEKWAGPIWAFRAPVGIKNLFLAQCLSSRGLRAVAWNVRAFDARARRPEPVVARVLRQVKPGSIILMHDGPGVPMETRVMAIQGVLQGLSARGLTCVVPDSASLR